MIWTFKFNDKDIFRKGFERVNYFGFPVPSFVLLILYWRANSLNLETFFMNRFTDEHRVRIWQILAFIQSRNSEWSSLVWLSTSIFRGWTFIHFWCLCTILSWPVLNQHTIIKSNQWQLLWIQHCIILILFTELSELLKTCVCG